MKPLYVTGNVSEGVEGDHLYFSIAELPACQRWLLLEIAGDYLNYLIEYLSAFCISNQFCPCYFS